MHKFLSLLLVCSSCVAMEKTSLVSSALTRLEKEIKTTDKKIRMAEDYMNRNSVAQKLVEKVPNQELVKKEIRSLLDWREGGPSAKSICPLQFSSYRASAAGVIEQKASLSQVLAQHLRCVQGQKQKVVSKKRQLLTLKQAYQEIQNEEK